VRLRARLDRNALHVTVSDSGPGFRPPGGEKTGVGLENVTRRLQLCYGAESQIQIQSDASGSSVSFSIPVNVAAPRIVEAAV
jgi:LytS/YehU family sensor histidine kinase